MPKIVEHGLTAVRVRQERKPGRYADGAGLYLNVVSSAARYFEWRGTVRGKRRTIAIGSVRLVTLAEARETARAWSKVARAGGDPRATRDAGKRDEGVAMTFAEAARTVHRTNIAGHVRNPKHADQWINTLERYAFPTIGDKPVAAVDQADVLRVLAPIWTTVPETARRVRQRLRTVLDWARTAGHREGVNPVEGVEVGLARQRDRVKHFTALPWADMPTLWPRLAAAKGTGARALRFAILTAARSGEVRGATWREIDVDGRTWTIPADRMKAGREHRVPLSDAAVVELGKPGEPDALVFPSARPGRPLSDMTLAAVLKRLDVPVTVHGFRSTFRDWCEESATFPHEVKEAALAHVIRNKTEAAYRRTDLYDRRIALMDEWSNFIVLP